MKPCNIADSVLELTADLVRVPSRAGVDPYDPILSVVAKWLANRGLPCEILRSDTAPVALCAVASKGSQGPVVMLNATLDTAGFGDESAWRSPPTSARVEDGWLYGRGTADSKGGAALFCHLLDEYVRAPAGGGGTLVVFFDLDEHTGSFAGIRHYFSSDSKLPRPQGVYIGYPGNDRIVTGGRGFLRAQLTVRGIGAHSGSATRRGVNAVLRAAHLAEQLTGLQLPFPSAGFPLPPQLTVTGIDGGDGGYSLVPDRCRINIDIRLTPGFDGVAARARVEQTVREFDLAQSPVATTHIDWLPGWPAYRLADNEPILAALLQTAQEVLQRTVPTGIAGPSNVGNFLSSLDIPAVSGFGLTYRGIHATDECIELASIAPVYQIYWRALQKLFS